MAAGTALIAATYGLVRLAYGLYLPDVQEELGFDAVVAGAISGGASIMYCVGALAGFLRASTRARSLVVVSALAAGTGAVGMALAGSTPVFAVFAVLGSAGAGTASPALVALVQRTAPEPTRARSQAVVNAGTGPGLVAAGILALVLLPDWRLSWAIAAVVAIGAAAVALLSVRRPEFRGPEGAARATAGTRSAAARLFPPASWFRQHARVIGGAILMGAGSAGVWTFTRTLLVDAGADEIVSILAWVALGIGGSAVIVSARWTDRTPPPVLWAATAVLIAAASVTVAAGAGTPPLVLLACVVFGWAYTAGSGALIAWTARLDAERAPTGTALLFVTLILGQAIGAVALGAIVGAGGHPPAFLAAAGVSATAALAALTGRHEPTVGTPASPPIA